MNSSLEMYSQKVSEIVDIKTAKNNLKKQRQNKATSNKIC